MALMEALIVPGKWTYADLATLPDDGHRYEIIDGQLIVTPSPGFRHQSVSGGLFMLLAAACPPGLKVLAAPFDVKLADDRVVEPDLLVARRADFTERCLPTAPLLAVEILYASTATIDLNLKKQRYAQSGIPSYWVVDPVALRLQAWELQGGVYVEIADVASDEEWTALAPYEVTVIPGRLLD